MPEYACCSSGLSRAAVDCECGGGFMPLVALMLSAPSAVVSDDRLCLFVLTENPQRVYAADQNLLPFVYGVCL